MNVYVYRYSLRFCFMPVLQNALNAVKEQWNNHSIAYNRNSACPHGRPNVLYILPEEKGTQVFRSLSDIGNNAQSILL